MPRLSSFALLTALASLSLASACKSDDAGGSAAPQQPSPAAAPAADDGAGAADGEMDQRRARRMQQFDKDGDGKLSRDERQAMVQDLLDRRMRRLDSDGDGKISRQEIGGGGRFAQHLSADFAQADQDRDQFISREELQKAMRRFRAQRRAERQQEGGAAPGGPAAPQGGGGAQPPAEDDDYGDSLGEE